MTIENVYEKMILGEIPPENAIAFFKTCANKQVIHLTMELQQLKLMREKTTDEQFYEMLSPGSISNKAMNDFNRLAQQTKAYGLIIGEYIKAAEAMIAKQEKAVDLVLDKPVPETKEEEKTKDIPPPNETLEKIAGDENSVLRAWKNNRYKCKNLRKFIGKYAEITGANPTKGFISNYLIKEKDGGSFTDTTIVTTLNTYGVSPERKKTHKRRRSGHKVSS